MVLIFLFLFPCTAQRYIHELRLINTVFIIIIIIIIYSGGNLVISDTSIKRARESLYAYPPRVS